jgi:hypothetical protein
VVFKVFFGLEKSLIIEFVDARGKTILPFETSYLYLLKKDKDFYIELFRYSYQTTNQIWYKTSFYIFRIK